MKRFLLFIVAAVAVVSLGLTIYYFSKDNEQILLVSPSHVINVGENIAIEDVIEVENRSEYTEITFSTGDSSILTYNSESETFESQSSTAKGGETTIIIKTSNNNYSNLTVPVTIRDGSESYPFLIDSAQQLSKIGTGVFGLDKHYQLTKDIYMANLGANYRWTPIGYGAEGTTTMFTGSFNGNGYAIYDVKIMNVEAPAAETEKTETPAEVAKTDAETQPVEGETSAEANDGADASYDVSKFTKGAGFFYGIGEGAIVQNLSIFAQIKGNFENAGAVAAINNGTIKLVKVINSLNSAPFISNGQNGGFIGGIAGTNNGTIYWSSVTGKLSSINSEGVIINAGGIAGHNYGDIFESYFVGALEKNAAIGSFGGIVGINDYKNTGSVVVNATINDCYAVITGISAVSTSVPDDSEMVNNNFFGGIIGKDNNYATNMNICNGCYFAVDNLQGEVPTCWIGGMYTSNVKTDYAGVTKLVATSKMKERDRFVRHAYANGEKDLWSSFVWIFGSLENSGYPVINSANTVMSPFDNGNSNVDTDEVGYITSAGELINALNAGVGSFLVTQNIDMAGYTLNPSKISAKLSLRSEGVDADSDGVYDQAFASITNLKIVNKNSDASKPQNVGLFETWTSGAIENIHFENVTITGDAGKYVGVFAGNASDVKVNNVTVKNVDVSLAGFTSCFGTLFGEYGASTKYISGVTIDTVTASKGLFNCAGGIVGVLGEKAKISESKNAEGNVLATSKNTITNVNIPAKIFGGVAGINRGVISYCDVVSLGYKVEYTTASALYSTDKHFVVAVEVSDQNVETPKYENEFNIGGIAGMSLKNDTDSSSIQQCTVSDNSTITIDKTREKTTTNPSLIRLGGIVGYNSANMTQATFKGKIVVNFPSGVDNDLNKATYVGGLIGVLETGTINNCLADGTIETPIINKGACYVGGLIGRAGITDKNGTMKIYRCKVAADIKGYNVGVLVCLTDRCAEFSECLAKDGTATGTYVAGLAKTIHWATGDKVVFTNCQTSYTLKSEANGESAYVAGMIYEFRQKESSNANEDLPGKKDAANIMVKTTYSNVSYEGSAKTRFAVTSWIGSTGKPSDTIYTRVFEDSRYFYRDDCSYYDGTWTAGDPSPMEVDATSKGKLYWRRSPANHTQFDNFSSDIWNKGEKSMDLAYVDGSLYCA